MSVPSSPIPGATVPDLAFHAQSHPGYAHTVNDDSWGHIPLRKGDDLFVVADGLGGAEGGATASQLVIQSLQLAMQQDIERPIETRLEDATRATNRALHQRAQQSAAEANMGSTVVALWIDAARQAASGIHVGDSRAYLFRQMELLSLTRDDSMAQEIATQRGLSPDEMGHHPDASVLLRALGTAPEIPGPLEAMPPFSLLPGDLFLLCSDGLTQVVPDQEIAQILAAHQTNALNQTCQMLLEAALQRGGPDNITVLLVQVPGLTAPPGLVHDSYSHLPMTQEQVVLLQEEHNRERRVQRVAIAFTLLLCLALFLTFFFTARLENPTHSNDPAPPASREQPHPAPTPR